MINKQKEGADKETVKNSPFLNQMDLEDTLLEMPI